ncbi:ABC transporter ATP-binding protein/permease [Nocardia rhizosphaerae]|uniref:ABC transporter ATP-binding protein/permease n=1 Tax=Nocardia rhizosphaerae TaxID=1691571 RepID=A0ABV8L3K8_9NOCA
METSRDWGNELFETLKWTAIAFPITVVTFIVVVGLLLRFTQWGRQFWRISGGFFRSRAAWRTQLFLLFLILLTVLQVRLSVLFTYWGNDMFTSLQQGAGALAQGDTAALDEAETAFWASMLLFAILAIIHVVRALTDYFAGQWFDIRWRVWLTERVSTDWLKDRSYYRSRFIDESIDNPDQRIEQDIPTFTAQSQSLSMGAVHAVLSVVSFTQVLWELSGPMTVAGVEIPRAMLVLVLVYVLITTLVAFWIGHPLIKLNFLYERVKANFRYAMVRVRDGAENVAFYRGERVERIGLLSRFASVIKTAWAIVFRKLKFDSWNLSVNQSAVIFPYLLQAPRFFEGKVTLGDLDQTARAFGEVHDSLSFFRESYDEFAGYRASIIRLDGLVKADVESRKLDKLTVADLDDAVSLDKIDVNRPTGEPLIDGLTLRLTPGDALVVKGASGTGKTTLLRALAEMWPYADGEFGRPAGTETLFLSQVPYIPLGDLRTAVCYPALPANADDDSPVALDHSVERPRIDDVTLREVLGKVHLGHLVDRLDEDADWAKILSPGEQQRLAFARILLIRPKVVFLDEATSSVDEGLEHSLYSLIRSEVPDTILFSVAHRSTVDRHHNRLLVLEGSGAWELSPVPA